MYFIFDPQVLQFDCTNTLNDQLLEDVRIQLELPEGFELVATVPCERLEYNIKVQCNSIDVNKEKQSDDRRFFITSDSHCNFRGLRTP